MLESLKTHAQTLKREALTLYIAVRDPRVPWYTKLLVGIVVAYTFSPIDLIPDFIPVLGHLDDLILTPLGIAIAVKTIPPEVITDARHSTEELLSQRRPISRAGAILVLTFWLITIAVCVWSTYLAISD